MVVESNYVHDCEYGFVYTCRGESWEQCSSTVTVQHNTIVDNGNNGVDIRGGRYSDTSYYVYNNLFLRNGYGLDQSDYGSNYATERSYVYAYNDYNAFYENGANFTGDASGGTNRITDDPELDESYTPPRPEATSPLLNAGDTGYRPDEGDYWLNDYDTTPTIGAVEY